MNCPRCSTPIPEHSRYCLSCGSSVSGDGDQTLALDQNMQARLQEELGTEFVIERELGRGGMAAVYLAQDMRLERKVAIKVLPPELTFGQPDAVERFRREARTAATLDHPHIIPIYRVSADGRMTWYVMKYLTGESLDRVLQRVWRMSVDATVQIVGQIASALEHAHEHKIVHRDVKPANAVMDAKGWVTVTDFGIAKAMESGGLTGTGSTIGTPFYMSPEQCSGSTVSGASDQYALGVMTYQMLAGRVPFAGQNVVDIIRRHCFDVVPPLAELRPEVPASVVRVIERAMAKRAEDRFPSVTSFAKALELTARGVDVGASYPPAGDQDAADTVIIGHVKDRRSKPRTVKTAPSRWKPAAALGGVVTIAALGVLAATLKPWQSAASPADSTVIPTQTAAVPPPRPVTPDTQTRDASKATPQSSKSEPAASRPQVIAPSAVPPPAPAPVTPTIGWISVGSRPNVPFTINGRSAPQNPVQNYEVPAGVVKLAFQLPDSTTGAVRTVDTVVMVRANDTLRVGYVRLQGRP